MNNEPKIMFGMSFFRDSIDYAKRTAEEFSKALWKEHQVALGIEIDGLNRTDDGVRSFLDDCLHENWFGNLVYIWDQKCDEKFFADWPSHLPMPFYKEGFSYGGAVNRILVLAKLAGCNFLVRIDPGTAPPYYFQQMAHYHTMKIKEGEVKVISGLYTDRIALRDNFVPAEKKYEYYQFVNEYTGVNPQRQITGGAAFTLSVSGGPPPIPFDGFTPVWASDDGLYEALIGNESLVLSQSRVLRMDPGIVARRGEEYPVRLASMVVLHELIKGFDRNTAENVAYMFLEELKNRGYCVDYSRNTAKNKLRSRINNIVNGFHNYKSLEKEWSQVIDKAAKIASSSNDSFVERVRQ